MPHPTEKHFWHRLESLRGIFALTVAVHHSFMLVNTHDAVARIVRGLQCLFYGEGAVLSFFILSGLVLGQSLRRSTGGVFRPFYIRRFFRIYPALAVSIFLGAILGFLQIGNFTNTAQSPFFQEWYRSSLTLLNLLKNLILCDFNLNNVTWTLWIEIVGSFFLPFFHILSRNATWRIGLMAGLIVLSVLPIYNGLNGALQYLWVFYLGYLIPLFPARIWTNISQHKAALFLVLSCLLTVCLLTPHFGHHAILYVPAMGFLIGCVFHLPEERWFRFLDVQVIRFYGRISYSFYLFHFIFLYLTASLLFWFCSPDILVDNSILMSLLLALSSIVIVTPVSYLSYLLIEKPSIQLGQEWARPPVKQKLPLMPII